MSPRAAIAWSIGPIAIVAALGTAAAALGWRDAVYVAGSVSLPLAVVPPLAFAIRPDRGARPIAVLLAALAINLLIEAGSTTAQLALLG